MLENLDTYGKSFQEKVIYLALTNRSFLASVYDGLRPEYFTLETHSFLIKAIMKYFEKYKFTPSKDYILLELQSVPEDFKNSIVEDLTSIFEHENSKDLKFIDDSFVEFCKQQAFKNIILESLDLIELKKFDKIVNKIQVANLIGDNRDIGISIKNIDIENLTNTINRNTTSCGWDVIDTITDGGIGLGTKELWIVIAPSGAGKSWVLCHFGKSLMQQGKVVLHYSLELSKESVIQRYLTMFSGYQAHDLKYNKPSLEKMVLKFGNQPGNIVVKDYASGVATVDMIASDAQKYITNNGPIDGIIVDYGDLIKSKKNYNERRYELSDIFTDLRALSDLLKVPLLTATQTNRSGISSDIVDASHVSEDYGKVQIGDFVFSFSRKIEDKVQHTARMHIIKNRLGPDGLTFPAKFDANVGDIEVYNSSDPMGKKLKDKMDIPTQNKVKKSLLKDVYYSSKSNQ